MTSDAVVVNHQDTLGKVTKLLANDLAKAEEEYADHLSNFRMYFKQLRTREERFSQLKKNKDSLQGKIDAAEKKLAKMSPEHKDLATLSQKLADLRNEMVGMEHSVMNEEAAIGDNRRQTARSAVTHQVS
jgi:DNA repair ATPase RecN